MSMEMDDALKGALRQELDPLALTAGFEPRVRSRLREHTGRRPARAPRVVLSVAVSVALVAAMVGGFLATRGSGTRTIPNGGPQNVQVLQDLTSGAAASPVADAASSYVWFTATGTGPACTATPWPGVSPAPTLPAMPSAPPVWGSPAPSACTGATDCIATWSLPEPSGDTVCQEPVTDVDVVDWTGTLRYHFQLSPAVSKLPWAIAAISPDGTRALLSDGTVIDQTGAAVGDLASVDSLFSSGNLRPGGPISVLWLSNDSGVCVAGPSGVMTDDGSASGQATTTGTTLEVVPMDGRPRTVATLATGQTSSDPISVDACNLTTDTATLAVFTATSASNLNAFSERVWSVRLSTGAVTYEQTPPVRTDEGQPWSIGSADGRLAVENTWNSQVDGCGAVDVVNVALGGLVPIATPRTCPGVFALSADGTRILGNSINAAAGTLDLVDAPDGTVVRSVRLPGDVRVAGAVAAPSGADFMLLVDGYLVLVDGSGGASQLTPAGLNLSGGSLGPFSLALFYTTG
jgi:hypothetical protein